MFDGLILEKAGRTISLLHVRKGCKVTIFSPFDLNDLSTVFYLH